MYSRVFQRSVEDRHRAKAAGAGTGAAVRPFADLQPAGNRALARALVRDATGPARLARMQITHPSLPGLNPIIDTNGLIEQDMPGEKRRIRNLARVLLQGNVPIVGGLTAMEVLSDIEGAIECAPESNSDRWLKSRRTYLAAIRTARREYARFQASQKKARVAPGRQGATPAIGPSAPDLWLELLPRDALLELFRFVGGDPRSRAFNPRNVLVLASAHPQLFAAVAQHESNIRDALLDVTAPYLLAGQTYHHKGTFASPRLLAHPPFTLTRGSVAMFAHRAPGNAFTGLADLRTGSIYLYPLCEDPPGHDGYGTTPWPGIGSVGFRGGFTAPIVHTDDPRSVLYGENPHLASHELLRLMTHADPYRTVGFTLWAAGGSSQKFGYHGVKVREVHFVFSSRGLNEPIFGTQYPTQRIAEDIVAACARDLRGSWEVLHEWREWLQQETKAYRI